MFYIKTTISMNLLFISEKRLEYLYCFVISCSRIYKWGGWANIYILYVGRHFLNHLISITVYFFLGVGGELLFFLGKQ